MLTSEVEGIGNKGSENRGGDKVLVYGNWVIAYVCVCVWGGGGHEREQEREMSRQLVWKCT
jgi:hypothetical protein